VILIISESIDSSTNDVIDWNLDSLEIIRLNRNDLNVICIDYQKKEVVFEFKGNVISSNDISSFWYRRGYINHDYNLNVKNLELEAHIYHHLNAEWNEIILFFNEMFDSLKIRTLGNNYQTKDRKLKQLNYALEVGLRIPKTFITSNKKDLLSFVKKSNQKIVTKGINSSPSFTFENVSLEGYTEPIKMSFVNSLPDTFYPSFFKKILKNNTNLEFFI
jgi:hypothetical protein